MQDFQSLALRVIRGVKAWGSNGQMFSKIIFFLTIDDEVESSKLDWVQTILT